MPSLRAWPPALPEGGPRRRAQRRRPRARTKRVPLLASYSVAALRQFNITWMAPNPVALHPRRCPCRVCAVRYPAEMTRTSSNESAAPPWSSPFHSRCSWISPWLFPFIWRWESRRIYAFLAPWLAWPSQPRRCPERVRRPTTSPDAGASRASYCAAPLVWLAVSPYGIRRRSPFSTLMAVLLW